MQNFCGDRLTFFCKQAAVSGKIVLFSLPVPVQVKELSFSAGIASHDLTTKLKQVESWLEKKHHVKITLRAVPRESAVNLVRKNVYKPE